MSEVYDFIVVGGGISGISCAQKLSSIAEKTYKILVLSASPLVKSITNFKPVTKFLHTFDVKENDASIFSQTHQNLTILSKFVSDLDSENHVVKCIDGSEYKYKKLCICSGGHPKLIDSNNPYVLGIRDTETVHNFQSRLKNARQIVIVGNGGIATELVHKIQNCNIIWTIRDSSISHTFFDSHSAKFFEQSLNEQNSPLIENNLSKKAKYTISKIELNGSEDKKPVTGSALGPDWSLNLLIKGANKESRKVLVEYKTEVRSIMLKEHLVEKNPDLIEKFGDWPVYVELTDQKFYGCDFIVSATGVKPSVDVFIKNNKFDLGEDGGLKVNERMETNIKDVYAAGDACTASWDISPHWFQMRLWSQAFQMGDYAARSMFYSLNNLTISLDFCFEMFAHITSFFNYKIVLLGNYDAKGLDNNYELLIRCTEGVEYVKIVIYNGKVQGALFIGETDLEETFENLILNQIDVSQYGEDLINPDIDIEDYFD
ncbi:unnamed protein product [Brachionus calyciflorus]|uniref:Pyridine nucleotide-disulfide oxidoreductase domain-containing protein 1 n=1 Tax=Brachionus calyciflorus TaxID=104777 RepID=A0A813NL57_9BILA|nr:unnamed protein product [Brachionus calyciflorus]